MGQVDTEEKSWEKICKLWLTPEALAMLFLGFSAGVPILLIFSTLSVWLREAGVSRAAVTFFSWAALGYSFKFIWAPIVDMLPLPFLTRTLGRRRSWLLVAQLLVISAIVWMASVDPSLGQQQLTYMAFAAVMLGFASATQDIVIDAYRIESAAESLQALLASMYIAGYRVGMLVAGAGSLFIADYLGKNATYSYGAWRVTYFCMALVMLAGVTTTLFIREPDRGKQAQNYEYKATEYLRCLLLFILAAFAFALNFFYTGPLLAKTVGLLSKNFVDMGNIGSFILQLLRFFLSLALAGVVGYTAVRAGLVQREMASRSYLDPIKDFFVRYGGRTAVLLLLLIGFYRLSDIVLGVVSNVFYLDMGFSKKAIAGVTKSFGLVMTIVGGFLGGVLTIRYGVNKILFLGAFLSSATNILFMMLANIGPSIPFLTVVIGADNLSAGIATTAFVAFLSSLTNVSFTAMQYAIFSSIMTLFPKLIGGYSGTMVSSFGYGTFFLLTALMGIPVLFLVVGAKRSLGELL